jgi:hypothetical protein
VYVYIHKYICILFACCVCMYVCMQEARQQSATHKKQMAQMEVCMCVYINIYIYILFVCLLCVYVCMRARSKAAVCHAQGADGAERSYLCVCVSVAS